MKINLKEYSLENLLFELSLYKKVKIDFKDYKQFNTTARWDFNQEVDVCEISYSKDFQHLINFLNWDTPFYNYCPGCRRETPLEPMQFEMHGDISNSLLQTIQLEYIDSDDSTFDLTMSIRLNLLLQNKLLIKDVKCIYDSDHEFTFIYKLTLNEIKNELELQKIGQFPSMTDFTRLNIDEYKSLMVKMNCYTDFVSAVRMNAQGMGVAALAYLRRVLEKVVDRVYEDEKSNLDISSKEFKLSTMNTRVKLLKVYLPEFLTSNSKNIYDLLSAGVHSLSEEQAKEIYPDLEIALIRIFNEKQAKIKDQQLISGTHKAISNHATRISENSKML